jgi:hypothetical protein
VNLPVNGDNWAKGAFKNRALSSSVRFARDTVVIAFQLRAIGACQIRRAPELS